MNRSATTVLSTAILFSLLASPTVRQNQAIQPTSTGNPAALGLKSTSPHSQKRPLQDASTKPPEDAGEADYKKELLDALRQYCADGTIPTSDRPCTLPSDNFLIALVPDPVHTHLALSFDRITDTIQEELQDDGYTFDHAVVPWDQQSHPEPDDYELRLRAKHYQESRELYPGLMLFRPSKDSDATKNPLVVLLIAESPTRGIQKMQFENAILQIVGKQKTKELEQERQGEVDLKILGPTFSGSLASLERLLMCGGKPCYKSATILSGTISGRDAVDVFRSRQTKLHATFDTFQETDKVMLERFVEFVSGPGYGFRGYKVTDVAELSEDETTYGALNAPSEPTGILRLYFPREISQLRAAYQDTSGSVNGDKNLPLQTLPHNFGVTGADDDTVTSFSQKQTPLSQEGVLLSIVAELRKHAIEFVVLRATDPLDLLFLSHYLRTAYPQGRIVTMNADMLFPREVEDTSLHGILALSTYSVSPSANHQFLQLRQSNNTERMFPSSDEIGTYNALHLLMTAKVSPPPVGCSLSSLDNQCTDELSSKSKKPLYLVQYGWRERDKQSEYNAPPVRLTALGHDGYWPIANLGPYDEEPTSTLLPQIVMDLPCISRPWPVLQFDNGPQPVEVPNSWIILEVVSLALALGFCVSLWFGSISSPLQQFAQFAPTMPQVRVWLIAAAATFLICLMAILLWPFVHGSDDWLMNKAWLSILSLVLAILTVGLVTLFDISERSGLLDSHIQSKMLRWSDLRNRLAVLAFVVANSAFALFAFVRPEHHAEHLAGIRHFEVLRAVQLTSGISPILPILFLLGAGLWWANHAVSGWILLDGRRPCLPWDLPPSIGAIGEDTKLVQRLIVTLQPGWSSSLHYLGLCGILLGIWFAIGTVRPIKSVEHAKYDHYQLLLFLILAWAALIGTTLRLWNIWFNARQLLLALDTSPLRRGFQRLEGFSWKPIWKFGGASALEEYRRILSREREALYSAALALPALVNSRNHFDKALKRTRDTYQKITLYCDHPFSIGARRRQRKVEQRVLPCFGVSQRAVAMAARVALIHLEDSWQRQREEPKRRRSEETPEELTIRACERFVSLVYVSFLLVILTRMRTLIVAIGGMYVLILLAMTLYPFEPKPSTQAFLVTSLVFIVTVVGLVFAQIHRDATLSHITDTKPGELGGDFYLRMASFIALPLFSLFAAQFPEVGRFFYSWLQPALQALNR